MKVKTFISSTKYQIITSKFCKKVKLKSSVISANGNNEEDKLYVYTGLSRLLTDVSV